VSPEVAETVLANAAVDQRTPDVPDFVLLSTMKIPLRVTEALIEKSTVEALVIERLVGVPAVHSGRAVCVYAVLSDQPL
jgi:hypothetical protein